MTLLIIPIALFAYGFMCSLVRVFKIDWAKFVWRQDMQWKEWR